LEGTGFDTSVRFGSWVSLKGTDFSSYASQPIKRAQAPEGCFIQTDPRPSWIIHEETLILKKAAKLGALARGVFEAFDTLSFLIEAQNMVQVPVLTGFYAF
jgi:hypothetical protein